ncbi:STAS domain-containing protein [Pseudodesulfovibrio sediminis]|uniref:STAS domain-containing protein n=1 Tax=Pseudodesulfovibrio sediminis TaxID=2810563 RepID=A0ABN6ELI9_9BACT|nr:STAS domain-containing protein [Pseudodesulfovibrio sediminis]BCS86857.1 hypothetical protein PSDVSF_00990 [Pseudodesulfovibrio sediminis]
MQQTIRASSSTMNIIEGVLLVQAPENFDDATFQTLRREILQTVHAHSVRGVLLDVSAIEVIDSVSFHLLKDTSRTVTIMGAKTIFVGFQPGVVSALIDLGVEFDDIEAAREMEDAMNILKPPLPECEAIEDEEMEELETENDDQRDETENEEESVERNDEIETERDS